MEDLKAVMTKCCETGEKIKLLASEMKEMRTEYKDLETMILERMEQNNIDVYNYNSKFLFKRKKKISKTGLNKESLSNGITIMFKDDSFNKCKTTEDKAEYGADLILNSREEKELYVLERKAIKN